MTDQWVTYRQASADTLVDEATLRQWVRREKVRADKKRRPVLVHLGDARRAERDWRLRASR